MTAAPNKPTPAASDAFPSDAAMLIANDVVPMTCSQSLVVAVAQALDAFATQAVQKERSEVKACLENHLEQACTDRANDMIEGLEMAIFFLDERSKP